MERTKKCIECGRELPLSDFYPHPRMKDKHLNKCIECVKRYEKKKYEENKKNKRMIVKICKYNAAAKLPLKAHEDDFCYDVYAVSEEQIAPNVWKYGLGFGLQILRDRVYCDSDINFSIDFRPRSSVWKTGMVLSNCEGTIDEGYTGEITAVYYHVMPAMPRYKVGDRIGQIKLGMALPMEFAEVEQLNKTERGAGGYGSTGK